MANVKDTKFCSFVFAWGQRSGADTGQEGT